jgi:hypothetical protein
MHHDEDANFEEFLPLLGSLGSNNESDADSFFTAGQRVRSSSCCPDLPKPEYSSCVKANANPLVIVVEPLPNE